MIPAEWKNAWEAIVSDLLQASPLDERHILVLGVSTSEVQGKQIGKGGSEEIAAMLYEALAAKQRAFGFHLAFQCCEHLNRALVVERKTAEQFRLEEVSAVPIPEAGGAMAAYAYKRMRDPVLVERIQAHAGIDVGDTFIGMHLRPVAVPVRPRIKELGYAHVTMARTRPKLIGGERAVYKRTGQTQ
ncbi:TIGR01440 family protein [Bacillaceae bacterium]